LEKKNIKKTEPDITKSVTEEKNINNISGIKVAEKKEIKVKKPTNKTLIKDELNEVEVKKPIIKKEVKATDRTTVKKVPKEQANRKTVAKLEEKEAITKKTKVKKIVIELEVKNKEILKNDLGKKDDGIDKYGRKLNKNDLTDLNTYLFHEGKNYEAYNILGAHITTEKRIKGVRFTTWAPNAEMVYVVGDFNDFEVKEEFKLKKATEQGLWSEFIEGINAGNIYKYCVIDENGNRNEFKSDPYAIKSELRPNNASIICTPEKFKWEDKTWVSKNKKVNVYETPMNIYEVHLGSWKTKENGDFLTYEEVAQELPKYVKEMGYTHVEIMPIVEHPLDASWGYQGTGYYSPTSRYGSLEGFKKLVQELHKEDIGVILDWAPGHFCKDANGLYKFDGTPTYEYQETWKAENKGWGTCNFDLGRAEVKSYLISNALYWLREFHIDGLRVDSVSSVLYLDYGRSHGEWAQNKYGGNGNLEGIEFFKQLNTTVFEEFPNALMIAEESTAWPNISKPVEEDGLGFNFKWDMGWMNDTLEYIELDPAYRRHHHKNITFAMMYNYSENFVLPLSHDEVVHGKNSLINKMWGDEWNKFAGLRVFSSYMMAHPGKKLCFMGSEFAQTVEWREYEQLQWNVIEENELNKQTQTFFKDLNKLYLSNKAFWELDYDYNGFEWIDPKNNEQSILVFMRKSRDNKDTLIFINNFKSEVYNDYQIGVPFLGEYEEIFNTDDVKYGGSGQVIESVLIADKENFHNQPYSLKIKVPPMATLVLKVKKIEEDEDRVIDIEKNAKQEVIDTKKKVV